MSEDKKSNAGQVKLTNVRLSFPDLFEAKQFDGQGPFKYRASFLFEPNSENHKKLLAAQEAVLKEAFKDKWQAVLKNSNDDSKLRFIGNGDNKTYDGYAGMLFVSATRDQTKGRPAVYDKNPGSKESPNLLAATDGKIYAGCYVNAIINLWPQDNKYGKTVRASLLSVQLHADGDAFVPGSAVASADEFEDVSDTGDSLVDET